MNRPQPLRRSWLRPSLLVALLATITLGCAARAERAKRTAAQKQAAATPHAAVTRAATGTSADARPLYDRLGGTPAVVKVVDDFVALAANDPKVNFTRKGQPSAWDATPENVTLLKKRLVEFLSTATAGDLHYNGQDMVTAHRGMNITDAEFDAAAADLKAAMEKHNVGPREQSELLAVVNRTRSAIVATSPITTPASATANVEAPKPPPFVPTPITSDETELDADQPEAADPSNK